MFFKCKSASHDSIGCSSCAKLRSVLKVSHMFFAGNQLAQFNLIHWEDSQQWRTHSGHQTVSYVLLFLHFIMHHVYLWRGFSLPMLVDPCCPTVRAPTSPCVPKATGHCRYPDLKGGGLISLFPVPSSLLERRGAHFPPSIASSPALSPRAACT